jgi:uncharacterized membrane protein
MHFPKLAFLPVLLAFILSALFMPAAFAAKTEPWKMQGEITIRLPDMPELSGPAIRTRVGASPLSIIADRKTKKHFIYFDYVSESQLLKMRADFLTYYGTADNSGFNDIGTMGQVFPNSSGKGGQIVASLSGPDLKAIRKNDGNHIGASYFVKRGVASGPVSVSFKFLGKGLASGLDALARQVGLGAASKSNSSYEFKVCNHSRWSKILVVIAYGERSTDIREVKGWYGIKQSECKTLFRSKEMPRFFYSYAENDRRGTKQRIYWGNGDTKLCVKRDRFHFKGQRSCKKRDLKPFSQWPLKQNKFRYTMSLD